VTGCFWNGGTEELAAAVAGFDDAAVDPAACVENARGFDVSQFRAALPREVERALAGVRREPAARPHVRAERVTTRPRLGLAGRASTRRPLG